MSKQKARGGKKQRYSIADIGGGDLTSQDVSTEKVLNFLIRGGLPEAETQEGTGRDDAVAAPGQEALQLNESSLPSQDAEARRATGGSSPRRSLDHLFNRANKGVPLKDTAPAAETVDHAAVEAVITEVLATPPPAEEDFLLAKSLVGRNLSVVEESPSALDETAFRGTPAPPVDIEVAAGSSPPGEAETLVPASSAPAEPLSPATDNYEAELTRHIERWKGFYRLKDGEVNALSTLFRLSHAAGSSECYVKMHKLAEESNLTYRYCQKVVRSLEQLGWIVKLKDYDASTQTGVLYRINLKPTE